MQPDTFYHIYNHANGNENLFRREGDLHFFLKKWYEYVFPMADTVAYCLMPNHFHALIRIRKEDQILELKRKKGVPIENFISQNFSNLFNSYTKSYNKIYGRMGSLFIPNFKKKEIFDNAYLTAVIVYIHRNPIHHGFSKELEKWKFSSYNAYLSDQKSYILKDFGLEWFGGKDGFIMAHQTDLPLLDALK